MYKPDCCKWCGKSHQRKKNEEAIFCFCCDNCKTEYLAWLKKHETKLEKGEFVKLNPFDEKI